MFILYAVVLGVIVGLILGGRLSALGEIKFRWWPLVFAGFLLQVVLFQDAIAARVGALGPPLYVASTLMVVVAVVRNIDVPGMALVALGAACNLAAILANGGFMPASPGAMAALGKADPVIYSNSAVLANPMLEPLTDIFALPSWLPFNNIFSIGDAILAVGVVVVIVTTMRRGAPAGAAGQPGDD
jgi:hypothetical protein